jgi:hypothetical protein
MSNASESKVKNKISLILNQNNPAKTPNTPKFPFFKALHFHD